ncbi:MAG: phosphatase PAP2 family protein, partial [Caulobacterales bacterium]
GAGSAAADPAPAAPPPPPPQLALLTTAHIEPSHNLPPPPIDGSDATAAELAELRGIAKVTTPDRWEQAKWDNDNENGTIFQSAVAPGFDLAALPATAKLLAEVRNEEAIAASAAKNYFKRTRPWLIDGTLKTCSRDEKPQTAYPSGHATMAFAMAVVLAKVMPEVGGQVMTRASNYSENRLVCAMHYRSDIVAGQTLGTAVAIMLLRDPKFEADVASARSELQSAHLTGAN